MLPVHFDASDDKKKSVSKEASMISTPQIEEISEWQSASGAGDIGESSCASWRSHYIPKIIMLFLKAASQSDPQSVELFCCSRIF